MNSIKKQYYMLCNRDYGPVDLICIIDSLFRYLDSINKCGYVKDDALQNTFFVHIREHLSSLGYEEKVIANSELTYFMWYNLFLLSFIL